MKRSVFLLIWWLFQGSAFCLVISRRSGTAGTIGQYSWGDPWLSKVVLGHGTKFRAETKGALQGTLARLLGRDTCGGYVFQVALASETRTMSHRHSPQHPMQPPPWHITDPDEPGAPAGRCSSACPVQQRFLVLPTDLRASDDGLLLCRTWTMARVCVTK